MASVWKGMISFGLVTIPIRPTPRQGQSVPTCTRFITLATRD